MFFPVLCLPSSVVLSGKENEKDILLEFDSEKGKIDVCQRKKIQRHGHNPWNPMRQLREERKQMIRTGDEREKRDPYSQTKQDEGRRLFISSVKLHYIFPVSLVSLIIFSRHSCHPWEKRKSDDDEAMMWCWRRTVCESSMKHTEKGIKEAGKPGKTKHSMPQAMCDHPSLSLILLSSVSTKFKPGSQFHVNEERDWHTIQIGIKGGYFMRETRREGNSRLRQTTKGEHEGHEKHERRERRREKIGMRIMHPLMLFDSCFHSSFCRV